MCSGGGGGYGLLVCRLEGLGFEIQGSGLRVQGSGFRVQGAGSRVQGSGFAGWRGACPAPSVPGVVDPDELLACLELCDPEHRVAALRPDPVVKSANNRSRLYRGWPQSCSVHLSSKNSRLFSFTHLTFDSLGTPKGEARRTDRNNLARSKRCDQSAVSSAATPSTA